jgi:hypothetical protein
MVSVVMDPLYGNYLTCQVTLAPEDAVHDPLRVEDSNEGVVFAARQPQVVHPPDSAAQSRQVRRAQTGEMCACPVSR